MRNEEDGVLTLELFRARIADNSDPEFVIAVVESNDVPVEILLFLADDHNPDIRYAIAENHNVDTNVLQKLVDDANPYVACRAQRTLMRLGMETSSL